MWYLGIFEICWQPFLCLTSLCAVFSLPMPLVPCPCAAAKPKKILSRGSNVPTSALSSNALRCDLVWFKLHTLRPDDFMDLTFEDDFWEHLGESIRWPSMSVLFH